MRILMLTAAVLCTPLLSGCQKTGETPTSINGPRGRFVGVGIYTPGQMWGQLVRPAAAADPAAATLDDDEQIIVVLDSATGELRQCGNLSGHCIGLNPWTKPLAKGQGLPAALVKHAQQLASETGAAGGQSIAPR